ncbi:E3 ubiquitin-protein ligase TRAF7-like isoform X2 [Oscarella lobularis]|uniref:E3 ubiquitin-protein ligase TRAF7-like isoform X2 n=1 Tax=Oscarella lobularis TaxID=121494 RepID=UPI0033138C56
MASSSSERIQGDDAHLLAHTTSTQAPVDSKETAASAQTSCRTRVETTFGVNPSQPVTTAKSMIELKHQNSSSSSSRRHKRNTSSLSNVSFAIAAEGSSDSTDSFGKDKNSMAMGHALQSVSSNFSVLSVGSIKSVKSQKADENDICVFVEEPSKRLFCMLCDQVFRDPVITTCGHTFCRSCATVKQFDKCPMDDCKLSVVVSNIAISDQIGELLIFCKYGCKPSGIEGKFVQDPNGCPVQLKISNRQEHERQCQFAPIQCPNSLHCLAMLKGDLEAHLAICEQTPCPHGKYGCPFRGTRQQIKDHLEFCRFESVKDFLARTDAQIGDLKRSLEDKDNEIGFLRSTVSNLSERLGMLERSSEIRFQCLETNQSKVGQDLLDTKHTLSFMTNELHQMQNQMGTVGMDLDQHYWKCKGTFVGHEGPVWALCVYGDCLFSGSSDKTIKVWDTHTNYKCLKTLEGHNGIVLALCIHGNRLYSGSADNSIRIWDIDSLECINVIQAHENPVCALATSANLLFSGSLKTIKVWDMHRHQMVRELPGQNHWVRALVATQNYLYSGSYQAVKIWNLNSESFECVKVVHVSGGSVYSIAVTEQYLIAATYENEINVWDVNSYKELAKLSGHAGTVYAVVVVPKGQGQMQLFSASYDRTLRVWHLETMNCVQTLIRHQGSVACLATARGRVYSGAVDSAVKVWQ